MITLPEKSVLVGVFDSKVIDDKGKGDTMEVAIGSYPCLAKFPRKTIWERRQAPKKPYLVLLNSNVTAFTTAIAAVSASDGSG